MTAHLLLLAHGAVASMRTGTFPLDHEPLEAEAAERLPALRLRHADRHLVSPMRRARETAVGLGVTATVEPALADLHFGRWRGQSLAEIEQREPQAAHAWLNDPNAAPHDGESLAALLARVRAWLDAQAATQGVTLAITHPTVIRAAIVGAIEATPRAFWRIDVAPLTMARLSGHAGQWRFSGLGPLAEA